MGARVGQRADDVQELGDPAGPAVGEEQRLRAGLRGTDVQEVHVRTVDLGDELGVTVQPRLCRAPVVGRGPVLGQLLEVADGHAPLPADAGQLVRPPGRRDPAAQIVEIGLWNVNSKWTHVRTHSSESFFAAGETPQI
jgi:hypothetical protein